jgi:hypothetical protein
MAFHTGRFANPAPIVPLSEISRIHTNFCRIVQFFEPGRFRNAKTSENREP